jgi:membrane-associated phospholipid phosphatase
MPATPLRPFRLLFAADLLTMAFALALGLLSIAASSLLPDWRHVLVTGLAVSVLVPVLALLRERRDTPFWRFVHDWSLAPLVYVLYRELYLVIGPLHAGRTRDAWLIAADRWIFGTDPTVWLARFAHPAVTEVLQAGYTLFYVLILTVGADLWRRRRDGRFHVYVFACAYAFYVLSYIGYLLVPAVGPRGTLHEYQAIDLDLPGLWLTPWLRAFVNAGGLAPTGVPNFVFQAVAHRDVFPSGHTMVTLVVLYWAWRHRLPVRWYVTVPGVLLIAATVYLRYHYVIDVLAGAALAGVCVLTTPALHGWVSRTFGTRDRVRRDLPDAGQLLRPAAPGRPGGAIRSSR